MHVHWDIINIYVIIKHFILIYNDQHGIAVYTSHVSFSVQHSLSHYSENKIGIYIV